LFPQGEVGEPPAQSQVSPAVTARG